MKPPSVDLHNRLLARGRRRADRLEAELARVIALLIDRAAEEAARNFAALATSHLSAAGDEQPPTASWTAPAADELLDVPALVAAIKARTDPVRKAVVKTLVSQAVEGVGIDYDVTNPLIGKAVAGSSRHITSIAETTRGDVMRVVAGAYDGGLTIPQTAGLIKQAIKGASTERGVMIARTELVGVVNGGSMAATQIYASVTGETMLKKWLTADGAQYPRHEDYDGLDGQTVGLDEAFDVGGDALQYPGDPDGSPEEVINCRCTLIYESASGEETGEGGDGEGGGGLGLSLGLGIGGETVAEAGAVEEGLATTDLAADTPSDWAWSADETRFSVEAQEPADWTGWKDSLEPSSSAALRDYSQGDYRAVNAALRSERPANAATTEAIGAIRKAFATAPEFDKPVTVWRGVTVDPPKSALENGADAVRRYAETNYPVGSVLEMDGFQSTSFWTDPALDASLSKGNPGLVFEIRTKRGLLLKGDLAHFDDEGEVLLDHRQQYRVVGFVPEATFEKGEYEEKVSRTVVQLEQM